MRLSLPERPPGASSRVCAPGAAHGTVPACPALPRTFRCRPPFSARAAPRRACRFSFRLRGHRLLASGWAARRRSRLRRSPRRSALRPAPPSRRGSIASACGSRRGKPVRCIRSFSLDGLRRSPGSSLCPPSCWPCLPALAEATSAGPSLPSRAPALRLGGADPWTPLALSWPSPFSCSSRCGHAKWRRSPSACSLRRCRPVAGCCRRAPQPPPRFPAPLAPPAACFAGRGRGGVQPRLPLPPRPRAGLARAAPAPPRAPRRPGAAPRGSSALASNRGPGRRRAFLLLGGSRVWRGSACPRCRQPKPPARGAGAPRAPGRRRSGPAPPVRLCSTRSPAPFGCARAPALAETPPTPVRALASGFQLATRRFRSPSSCALAPACASGWLAPSSDLPGAPFPAPDPSRRPPRPSRNAHCQRLRLRRTVPLHICIVRFQRPTASWVPFSLRLSRYSW